MVIFHLEDCPHSQCKDWFLFWDFHCWLVYNSQFFSLCLYHDFIFYMLYITLSALKKAFAEDKEIQKLADDEFVILNLVVSKTLPFVNINVNSIIY